LASKRFIAYIFSFTSVPIGLMYFLTLYDQGELIHPVLTGAIIFTW